MSRKGLNITKRKDGRWEARVIYTYDENRKAKYRYLYGKTFAEVKHKRENLQSEILLGRDIIPPNDLYLRDICEFFLIHKQITVKRSTLLHYKGLIKSHLSELGSCRLSELSSTVIEKYSHNLLLSGRKDGVGLSVKTVRDVLSLLRSVLKYAVDQKYITADVMNFSIPHQVKKQYSVLEKKEQLALESFALGNIDSYKLGIFLALYTGLRIGELCALCWSDIDLKQSQLSISRTLQRVSGGSGSKTEIVITEPKTKTSIRTIPLPKFLCNMLTALKGAADTYVLTGTNKYIEPSNYYMRYTRWLKRLDIKHYSFHALRHTFATRCIENGFDVKSLSELLGHADVNITLNRYVHPSMETKIFHMEKLAPISTHISV